MPQWQTHRTHRFYCEDDQLYLELHGMFELTDCQLMYSLSEAILLEHGYCLTLFDARGATGMTSEARKYIGEKTRTSHAAGASALVGASFALRTLTNLMQNAARLIGRPLPPVRACSTIDEGMLWLSEQRKLFLVRRSIPPR